MVSLRSHRSSVGILAGAVLARIFGLAGLPEVSREFALGFAFGWTVFQALFMRDMVGGSYIRSLAGTFIPELLSMNHGGTIALASRPRWPWLRSRVRRR